MKLTDNDVQEIIRLLDDSAYDEFQIETEQFKLILRRAKTEQGGWSQQRHTLTEPDLLTAADSPSEGGLTHSPKPDRRDEQEVQEEGLKEILAPIIGTFYRAPQPGTPPFVKVGSMISQDTVVAIIEVMKLMNSVLAGAAGEVVEICIKDGEFVEQGQCLMRLRPEQG